MIAWIERWKGLLIFLVVSGHVAGGAAHLCVGTSQQGMEFLYKFIYLFHMPAFFWLAGLCWKPSMGSFGQFVWKKTQRLLVPYFVFGIFSVLAYLIIMHGGKLFESATTGHYRDMAVGCWSQPFVSLLHGGGWPRGEGFRCNSVLWFLPAMFSVTCCYWWIDRWLKERRTQLALAGLLLVLAFVQRKTGLAGSLPFGFSYVPWYGAFLILGRWVRVDECTPPAWALAVGWGGLVILTWATPNCYFAWIKPLWYVVFGLMGIGGVVLSLWTAQRLKGSWWLTWGGASMGIMLIHKFVVLFLQVKLPLVARWAAGMPLLFRVSNAAIVLAAMVLSVAATTVIRRSLPWALGEKRK